MGCPDPVPAAHHPCMSGEVAGSFPKTDRILKRDQFRRVYDQGLKIQARYFTAFSLSNSGEQSRLGITTTRKIGKSVLRNRARRLLRETFRRNRRLVPVGIDIVINVKPSLAAATYREVEADFVGFLEKVRGK